MEHCTFADIHESVQILLNHVLTCIQNFEHYTSMQYELSQTYINDTVKTLNINAICDHEYPTRLYLQFGYTYEHYAQAHICTVINK